MIDIDYKQRLKVFNNTFLYDFASYTSLKIKNVAILVPFELFEFYILERLKFLST